MSLYDRKFCLFDEISTPITDIEPSDLDLKSILSFHPIHNKVTAPHITDIQAYNPDRRFIETDRSGFRGYDKVYSKYFTTLRHDKLNLLEIGIEYGYGVLAWSRYFTESKIYGLDIVNRFKDEYEKIQTMFPEESSRITFNFPYNSVNNKSWAKLFSDVKFDIVIDDGSHNIGTQLKTINNAIPYLKDRCIYSIEDIKLEICSDDTINQVYNALKRLHKKNFTALKLYRHINPGRLSLLSLSRTERIEFIYNRGISQNKNYSISDAVYRDSIDTGNYYNYMAVFSR